MRDNFFPSQDLVTSCRANTLFLFKPSYGLKNQFSALRSHKYNFDDNFINHAAGILGRTSTTGAADATETVIREARRHGAISLSDEATTMFDYSQYSEFWKFVLYLNEFPGENVRGNWTVVVSGICVSEGGNGNEEPINPATGNLNYNCILLVQHRTVVKGHQAVGPYDSGNYGFATTADTSYLYPSIITDTTTRSDLFENRPSAFNWTPRPEGLGDKLSFDADPLKPISDPDNAYGPVAFNRFAHNPDVIVRDVVEGVTNQMRKRTPRGFGGSDLSASISSPAFDISSIGRSFEEMDADGPVLTSHLGPRPNARLTVHDVEFKYGVSNTIIRTPPNTDVFTKENIVVASTKNIYYGLFETLLPTFAANRQIMTMELEVVTSTGDFGNSHRIPKMGNVTGAVVDMPTGILESNVEKLFDELDAAIFKPMQDQVSGFRVVINLNMCGTTYVHIVFFDEWNDPDSIHSFTSSYNSFAVPMIGTSDQVRFNQNMLGGMVSNTLMRQNTDVRTLHDDIMNQDYRPRRPSITDAYGRPVSSQNPPQHRAFDPQDHAPPSRQDSTPPKPSANPFSDSAWVNPFGED